MNSSIVSTQLDWKRYIAPQKDKQFDFDECRSIDEFNQAVWEFNNKNLAQVNEILEKLGRPPEKLEAPPKYLPIARREYSKRIREPSFCALKAIEYLHKECDLLPFKDYVIGDAAKLADDHAEKREIEQRCAKGLIDVTAVLGANHTDACTCNNKWDGKSERCEGRGARLRWKRGPCHHFLEPDVRPESY